MRERKGDLTDGSTYSPCIYLRVQDVGIPHSVKRCDVEQPAWWVSNRYCTWIDQR